MIQPSDATRTCFALVFSIWFAYRALKKKSLSPSGAIAGFIVCFVSMAISYRFGITLLLFYFSSSKLTKYKSELKKQQEYGVTHEAGYRSARQVFSCSLPAIIIAIYYAFLYQHDSVVSASEFKKSFLLCSYLGFFACCNGDTWSSEIGSVASLSREKYQNQPRLVLPPFPKVPPGTNGGVSLIGSISSVLAGIFIGFFFYLLGPVYAHRQYLLIVVGAFGGAFGSWLDSMAGAVLQATYYDEKEKKIVSTDMLAAYTDSKSYPDHWTHISGRNIFTNETVNVVTSTITSLLCGLFAYFF